jgi:hypothetical protein
MNLHLLNFFGSQHSSFRVDWIGDTATLQIPSQLKESSPLLLMHFFQFGMF